MDTFIKTRYHNGKIIFSNGERVSTKEYVNLSISYYLKFGVKHFPKFFNKSMREYFDNINLRDDLTEIEETDIDYKGDLLVQSNNVESIHEITCPIAQLIMRGERNSSPLLTYTNKENIVFWAMRPEDFTKGYLVDTFYDGIEWALWHNKITIEDAKIDIDYLRFTESAILSNYKRLKYNKTAKMKNRAAALAFSKKVKKEEEKKEREINSRLDKLNSLYSQIDIS